MDDVRINLLKFYNDKKFTGYKIWKSLQNNFNKPCYKMINTPTHLIQVYNISIHACVLFNKASTDLRKKKKSLD